MSRCDWLALVVCLAVLLASLIVSFSIYAAIPHIEDEMAFVWQSRLITQGRLSISSPQPNPSSFVVPFVIDYQGRRFGKYPIGWPVVLAAGEQLQVRGWINPLLSCLTFWLIYRTLQKIVNEHTALLAIVLGLFSPFFLVNAGSLLSHSWSLCLSVIFIGAWLDAFTIPNPALPGRLACWLPTITGALALGLLTLTRPWTAVAVSLPFIGHAGYLLLRKPSRGLLLRLCSFCLIAGTISALYFVWQYSVTGSFRINPYTLWWPYDRIGFGPGSGLQPGGYQPGDAWANTLTSLYTGNTDLFGWPFLSWLFLPFGCITLWKNFRSWLIALPMVALISAYALYWTQTQVFGPRYYFEGLPAVLLFSAAGIRWLSGRAVDQIKAVPLTTSIGIRRVVTSAIVIVLITANLIFYLPPRLRGMAELSGISTKCISPLTTFAAKVPGPLLIFIHVQQNFHEYSCSLDINDPFGRSPILTAVSRGKVIDQTVASGYPDRLVYHYYPDTGQFRRSPRSQPDPLLEIP
jgi:hypothetical protein